MKKLNRSTHRFIVNTTVDQLPKHEQSAFQQAIDLIKRYQLPCDVEVAKITSTARHVWRKDGTCAIQLSVALVYKGDAKAVHRRIIHEAAHHIAGLEHTSHDDPYFKKIASRMYTNEGYAPGKPGDHCGNM